MEVNSLLQLSILGPTLANLDGEPLPKLPTVRAQGLLIYLAVEAALGTPEQRGEAVAEYETCVEVLWNELGIEPSFETLKLREDILAGDLAIQETISRPLPPTQEGPRHNLPAQLTPFIGREREIAEIQELLGTARLITLTGPGGTGKTRLGLHVAESVTGNYADGLTFVALASTTDPELIPNTIAHELGLAERPDQPLVESLKRYFNNKHILLFLDNFEHVLEAAPLVSDLLAAAPQLSVLTTSRETLHLSGEYEYPVPPLALPDPTHIGSMSGLSVYESVVLFIQRARAASPNFSLTEGNAATVASICLRLDGLPLAMLSSWRPRESNSLAPSNCSSA